MSSDEKPEKDFLDSTVLELLREVAQKGKRFGSWSIQANGNAMATVVIAIGPEERQGLDTWMSLNEDDEENGEGR